MEEGQPKWGDGETPKKGGGGGTTENRLVEGFVRALRDLRTARGRGGMGNFKSGQQGEARAWLTGESGNGLKQVWFGRCFKAFSSRRFFQGTH